MRPQLADHVCSGCGHVFQAGHLMGGYGSWLARSEATGEPVLVDMFNNVHAQEAGRLAKQLTADLRDREQGEVGRQVTAALVDPDPSGATFSPAAPPRCPICHSTPVEFWKATSTFVEEEVPVATFGRFAALPEEQRRVLVGTLVSDARSR